MIIDSHTHIGVLPPFYMTADMLLDSMARFGIDFSLVSNIECAENDHEGNPVPPEYRVPQNEVLRKTLNEAKKAPDKLGVLPWLRIENELPDAAFEELLRENREIIYGLKLHPFHSKTAPDDERLEPVYRLAAEYELPIVSHTGGREEAMSPHLYNAAKRHPELDFVMVHMDLGTDNRVALDLLGALPNLYGDTTWVPIKSTLYAIERCGSEKILFGTDNPIDGKRHMEFNRAGQRSLCQEYFREFRDMVSAEDYENIMHQNAERLFHIKEKHRIMP